jgi:hypothetical protein
VVMHYGCHAFHVLMYADFYSLSTCAVSKPIHRQNVRPSHLQEQSPSCWLPPASFVRERCIDQQNQYN